MSIFPKDPASIVDFSINWADWLVEGEAIAAAAWNVEPDAPGSPEALQLTSETTAGDVTSIFVGGGRAGDRYRLTCTIETDAGRTADRSLTLRIMEQ